MAGELKFTLTPSEGRMLRMLLQYQGGQISKEVFRTMVIAEGIKEEYLDSDEHLQDLINHWNRLILLKIG